MVPKLPTFILHIACALALFVGVNFVTAEEVKVESVILLNRMQEFEQRAADSKTMAGYIKAIEKTTLARLGPDEIAAAKSGFVTVAIRPNQKMKLWIDIDGESLHEAAHDVQNKMASKGVPIVAGGPIAFMLTLTINGETESDKKSAAKETTQPGLNGPPVPAAWRDALEKTKDRQLKIPDDILPLVWPVDEMAVDDAKPEMHRQTFVPDGYVLQSLDPLGGSLARPKDWHYSEGHREQQFMWTVSKEPPEGGYETGVRIQLFLNIKKRSKQSAQMFIQNFVRSKSNTVKVLSRREPIELGFFNRVGLETEEPQADASKPPFRILYSCFWSNDLDTAAITISGTTADQWEANQEAFDVMASMVLIAPDKIKRDE